MFYCRDMSKRESSPEASMSPWHDTEAIIGELEESSCSCQIRFEDLMQDDMHRNDSLQLEGGKWNSP